MIKWGTLLELARRFDSKHILQVLYYRRNEWGRIEIDGESVDIAKEVIQHFRDSTSIRSISKSVRTELLAAEFHDRKDYLQLIKSAIDSRPHHPGIVFLDPDTGLEPESGNYNPTHVLRSELAEIWQFLRSGDLLVLYQHEDNRAGAEWKDRKRLQFANALDQFGILPENVKVAYAENIARDVAFFFVQKS